MQPPGSAGRTRPSGSGEGCRPWRRSPSTISAIRGACGTGGCGNGARAAARSDRRRPGRAPGTGARPARSTAERLVVDRPRGRHAVRVLDGLEVLAAAGGRARCPRTSCCRRRCSACTAGTPAPRRPASARWSGSGGPSTPPPGSSFVLLRDEVAALEHENARRRRRRGVRHRAAAGAAADDDDVVVFVRIESIGPVSRRRLSEREAGVHLIHQALVVDGPFQAHLGRAPSRIARWKSRYIAWYPRMSRTPGKSRAGSPRPAPARTRRSIRT